VSAAVHVSCTVLCSLCVLPFIMSFSPVDLLSQLDAVDKVCVPFIDLTDVSSDSDVVLDGPMHSASAVTVVDGISTAASSGDSLLLPGSVNGSTPALAGGHSPHSISSQRGVASLAGGTGGSFIASAAAVPLTSVQSQSMVRVQSAVPGGRVQTRWGRCLVCDRAMRPCLSRGGWATLVCSNAQPGQVHTRRTLSAAEATAMRFPLFMVSRVRVLW
jgi:hypothetical protein